MASYGNTAKYALRKLLGSSLVSEIDTGIAALADDVDAKMVGRSSGPLGSRPTSTSGTPGLDTRLYRATNAGPDPTGSSTFYADTGTGWVQLAHLYRVTQAWDPPSLATGATARTSAPLAALFSAGDIVTFVGTPALTVNFSLALPAGMFLTVHFESWNAMVTLVNLSGSTQNLGSGTLTVAAIL